MWVLFSDAARVRVHDLRATSGRSLRLLGVGLPLTVLAGWGLAAWLFPALGVWLALLVGAALAPTDAALGVPVVTNPAVPSRVRRLITVESGLNDGIVTPVVMVAIAGAAAAEGCRIVRRRGCTGRARDRCRRRCGDRAHRRLAAALGTRPGLGRGGLHRHRRPRPGPAGLPHGARRSTATGSSPRSAAGSPSGPWPAAVARPSSSSSSRPAARSRCSCGWPSAPSPCRSSLDRPGLAHPAVRRPQPHGRADGARRPGPDRERHWTATTVLFIGWFGPRGLASLVFALLALEELGPDADERGGGHRGHRAPQRARPRGQRRAAGEALWPIAGAGPRAGRPVAASRLRAGLGCARCGA